MKMMKNIIVQNLISLNSNKRRSKIVLYITIMMTFIRN